VTFDALAATYDERWTNTAIGRAQRDLVWRHLDPLFRSGDRILDFGCGTGEDAAHFAARGIQVHAVDPSAAMVAIAYHRGGFTVGEAIPSEQFDGVLSNFGALNCIADLSETARTFARVVRPGGRVAICVMGRFCAWEIPFHPLRRLRGRSSSSLGPVYYPTAGQLATAFAPEFTLRRVAGIGLFVPPSYVVLPKWVVRACAALDRALAHLPVVRALADHRLLIFERN